MARLLLIWSNPFRPDLFWSLSDDTSLGIEGDFLEHFVRFVQVVVHELELEEARAFRTAERIQEDPLGKKKLGIGRERLCRRQLHRA